MTDEPLTNGIERFYQAICEMQEKVILSQREQLEQAARQMAQVIAGGGRIFLFGSGHSHLILEEAFYRAGGLAPATPIFSSLLMLHENPALSSRLERTPGLAAPLLERYQPAPGEILVIISNSGVNQLPLEMAQLGREKGMFIITLSSLAYSRVAPLSALGKRLNELADIALDNGGIPGDALVEVGQVGWRAGPSSTILVALMWNCLVVECSRLLVEAGHRPPIFGSFNMPNAAEWNADLLAEWRELNPHL